MAWFNCHKSDKGIKQGGILNVQAPAPGQSGYINFARIKLLDSYANHTCCFVIQNRGIYFPVMLSIGFQNINHTDPGLISFLYWGAADYGIYAVQNTTSVWDLYVKKTEPHDAVEILNLNYDTAHFEITFPNAFTEEKGEGWMSPQPGGRVAGADHVYDSENDGGITFSYAKPGMNYDEFTWLACWNGYEMRAVNKGAFTYLTKTNVDADNGNIYYGMCMPYKDGSGADDQEFLRTTAMGLIPYRPGDMNNSHCSLGTNTWWFRNAHIQEVITKNTYANEIMSFQGASGNGAVRLMRQAISLRPTYMEFYSMGDSYARATFGAKLYAVDKLCFCPNRSSTGTIGDASYQWNQFYATNGLISTSDKNEKEEISYTGQKSQYEDTAMSDTQLVKFILGLLPCIFKRKNGESGRPHHGIVAQDFEELMKKIGLHDHAAFIKSPKTKEIEIIKEDGSKEIKTQEIPGEYIYGIRYEELISDVIRFCQILYQQDQEQQEKIENLEKRLTELENIVKKGA